MFSPSFGEEISAQLHKLTLDQQQQLLAFVRALTRGNSGGVPGRKLLHFAGAIDPDELRVIEQAISEGCEQVNLNEWKT